MMPRLHVLLEGEREEGKGGEGSSKSWKFQFLLDFNSLSNIIVWNWNFPSFSEIPTCSQIWRGRTDWSVVGCSSSEKTCCRSAGEPWAPSRDGTGDWPRCQPWTDPSTPPSCPSSSWGRRGSRPSPSCSSSASCGPPRWESDWRDPWMMTNLRGMSMLYHHRTEHLFSNTSCVGTEQLRFNIYNLIAKHNPTSDTQQITPNILFNNLTLNSFEM